MRSFVFASALALALAPAAHGANVYPAGVIDAATFNWSTGADGLYFTPDDVNLRNRWGVVGATNGGSAAVTGDHVRAGNGSLRLSANGGTNAKAGVAYYPGTQQGFGPLSGISAASFEWMRAAGSDASDQGPLMRLYLFTPGSDTHVATLAWTTAGNGGVPGDDSWQVADVAAGQVVQTRAAGPQYNIPMAFAAAKADPAFSNLIVRAVEVGFGSGGWGPNFEGAVDQVRVTGSVTSVNSNFEAALMAAPPPTPVPTVGLEGLLGLSAAIGAAAWFRRRTRARRD